MDVKALKTEAFEIKFHIADSLTKVLIVRRAAAAREERQESRRQVPDCNVGKLMGRRRRVMAHEKELEELGGLGILNKQRDANLRREGHGVGRKCGKRKGDEVAQREGSCGLCSCNYKEVKQGKQES